VVEWNDTACEYTHDLLVHEMFEEQAQLHLQAIDRNRV
jgi:hypothetical protein